ncbi:MAG: thiol:disulfide interchange protein DsbA/DsbL [Rubrivivax sp.]
MTLLVAVLLVGSRHARAELVAGRDYQALRTPLTTDNPAKLEVIEFFSYACPRCAELHGLTAGWTSARDVAVRRVPVVMGRPDWSQLAILYYALESLGQLKRLDAAVFEAVKQNAVRLSDAGRIADWVAAQGVDRKQYMNAANSFAVTTKVKRAEVLARDYRLGSVPAIAIDGRYVVTGTTAMGGAQLFRLANEVLDKARGERRRP